MISPRLRSCRPQAARRWLGGWRRSPSGRAQWLTFRAIEVGYRPLGCRSSARRGGEFAVGKRPGAQLERRSVSALTHLADVPLARRSRSSASGVARLAKPTTCEAPSTRQLSRPPRRESRGPSSSSHSPLPPLHHVERKSLRCPCGQRASSFTRQSETLWAASALASWLGSAPAHVQPG